jgi:hypothetical protein
MKIRHGFVSNSSTTSFCIYGTWIDLPEPTFEQEEDEDNAYEDMYDFCNTNGLECHYMEGVDGCAVGLTPRSIKDNETGGDFKLRVKEKISKLFNIEDVDTEWIEEAYYS